MTKGRSQRVNLFIVWSTTTEPATPAPQTVAKQQRFQAPPNHTTPITELWRARNSVSEMPCCTAKAGCGNVKFRPLKPTGLAAPCRRAGSDGRDLRGSPANRCKKEDFYA